MENGINEQLKNNLKETFARRLMALRTERGFSRKQLAAAVRVSESSIRAWENGDRLIENIFIVMRIAEFFNVSIDFLSGRDDVR